MQTLAGTFCDCVWCLTCVFRGMIGVLLLWFLQCFDLRNYIESNSFVSGGRWRCASCEDFVSLQSLQHCGLTASLLEEFKDQASVDRDRVEFCANGSYRLLDERKSRYSGKRPAAHDDFSFGQQDAKRSKPNSDKETVIGIDDDDDDQDVIVID